MSIFRTIALFVYLFGYMIVHYSVLCKAERALAAGDTETVRQLVKKHIPHWSKGILNVTGVRLSVEGRKISQIGEERMKKFLMVLLSIAFVLNLAIVIGLIGGYGSPRRALYTITDELMNSAYRFKRGWQFKNSLP